MVAVRAPRGAFPSSTKSARLRAGALAALALLAGGCAGLTLKRPQAVRPSALPIKGHSPSNTHRDERLYIASYQVREVSGTPILPPGLTAYGRVQDQSEWDYRFELAGRGKLLRGECHESVGAVRYYGFGKVLLDLRCRCFDGAAEVAELKLADEQGSVTLPGSRYAIRASRRSEQGKSSRTALGYHLSGGRGEGAVDTTKHARAFLPRDLPETDEGPLVCVYAALLLHRHEK